MVAHIIRSVARNEYSAMEIVSVNAAPILGCSFDITDTITIMKVLGDTIRTAIHTIAAYW